jgi:hypothetical protein
MRSPISCPSWVIILLVLTIISCNKNDIGAPVQPPGKGISNLVNIQLSGRITDEGQQPVSGAIIRSGTLVVQSDINGNFSFSTLSVNPHATLVEVNKSGFFRSYKTIEVQPESGQFVDITLKKQSGDIQFNAQSGTLQVLNNGGQINFPANAMTDKVSGQQYTGTVSLAAYSLFTSDNSFYSFLPGIKGKDIDKRDVVLHPISMVVAELAGSASQSLEIAAGTLASVQFPIAATDLGQAPATISMWHYDAGSGIWMEEGKAIKNGSYYEGTVSHFSIWTCADASPLISMQANITDKNGNGLSYARIQLFENNNEKIISPIARADGTGYVTISAPANKQLVLKVLNDCGGVLANKNISTANAKLWLGKLEAAVDGNNSLTISGKVDNCKNGGVYNGHVTIDLEGKTYRTGIMDGSFSITMQRCTAGLAMASVVAVDNAGAMESSILQFEVGTGTMDIGTISTCDPANSQFVSYNINGTNYLLQAPADSLVQALSAQANKTIIHCYSGTNKVKPVFSFTFTGEAKPGQYPVGALNINQDKLAFAPSGNIAVEITNYGMPGGFITGKCIGRVKSPSFNQPLPFSFNFKVLRQF